MRLLADRERARLIVAHDERQRVRRRRAADRADLALHLLILRRTWRRPFRGESSPPDLFAQQQPDRPRLRGEDRRARGRRRRHRLRKRHGGDLVGGARRSSSRATASSACEHRLSRRLPPLRDAAEALDVSSQLCRRQRPRRGRGGAAGLPLLYLESPTSWTVRDRTISPRLAALARAARRRQHDRQQLGDAGVPAADQRSASISSCTPPPNISAATAMWWRASSPGRRDLVGKIRRDVLPVSRRQARALRRLAAAARPAHPADADEGARGGRASPRDAARRATRGDARPSSRALAAALDRA